MPDRTDQSFPIALRSHILRFTQADVDLIERRDSPDVELHLGRLASLLEGARDYRFQAVNQLCEMWRYFHRLRDPLREYDWGEHAARAGGRWFQWRACLIHCLLLGYFAPVRFNKSIVELGPTYMPPSIRAEWRRVLLAACRVIDGRDWFESAYRLSVYPIRDDSYWVQAFIASEHDQAREVGVEMFRWLGTVAHMCNVTTDAIRSGTMERIVIYTRDRIRNALERHCRRLTPQESYRDSRRLFDGYAAALYELCVDHLPARIAYVERRHAALSTPDDPQPNEPRHRRLDLT